MRETVNVQTMHERIAEFGAVMGGGVREATLEMYAPLHPLDPPQTVVRDVAYGPDPRHRLDVHLPSSRIPDSRSSRPVLLFVHGGGFVGGDKGGPGRPLYDNVGRFAVECGFMGVTMTYRLAPEHPWPAGGDDVGLALRFLVDHAADFGGDGSRLCVFGHSAGGAHVATFLADVRQRDGIPGLRAAVLSSGIYAPELLVDEPYSAYYGPADGSLKEKSVLDGLAASAIPLLVLFAEFDPSDFHRQAAALLSSITSTRGRLPHVAIGAGHNHFSSPAHYGTVDRELSDLVARFLTRSVA